MAHATIDGELEAELTALAEQAGYELVHAEFRDGTLRIFLDRPEGVTLADCAAVSREVSALLDVAGFGPSRYTLEVSSPGLDRQLYGPKDYERFCGHRVRVTRTEPETRRKETLVGCLEEFRPASPEDLSEITLTEVPTGRRFDIVLRDIQAARLEIVI